MNLRGVLESRARALRNALFGRGRTAALRPRGPFYSLAVGLFAAWICHRGFVQVFTLLEGSGATAAQQLAALALLLDLALVMFLLLDLESAISTLVLDGDLDLLRRAPLRPREILGIKLLDASPRIVAPIVLIAFPALLAYAGTQGASGRAWLAAPLALALLWSIPLGVGTALTLALVSRFPARRVRESLGLVSTVMLGSILVGNLFGVTRLIALEGDPADRIRGMLDGASRALARTPGGWVAALFGGGAPGEVARSALALLASAAASLALGAWAAGRVIAPVQDAARTPVARRPRRAARPRTPAHRAPLALAVMRRDRLIFVRDWTVLGDVLIAVVMWTLLPLLFLPLRPVQSPTLVRAMLLALSIGMGYEIGTRAFPLERRGAAWIRLAPVPARSWAAARMLSAGAMALLLVLIMGLSLGWAARFGPGEWLKTIVIVLPALALSVALGLWTGATFGNPEWTSARSVLTLGGRLASSGLMTAQVAAWLTLTVVGELTGLLPGALLIWLPAMIATVLSFIVLEGVARRISRPGYDH